MRKFNEELGEPSVNIIKDKLIYLNFHETKPTKPIAGNQNSAY